MVTVATRPPDVLIRGRKVVGGVVEGEALATSQTISGWGGVNPMKGEIIETGDPDEIYYRPKEEYTKKLISSIPGLKS